MEVSVTLFRSNPSPMRSIIRACYPAEHKANAGTDSCSLTYALIIEQARVVVRTGTDSQGNGSIIFRVKLLCQDSQHELSLKVHASFFRAGYQSDRRRRCKTRLRRAQGAQHNRRGWSKSQRFCGVLRSTQASTASSVRAAEKPPSSSLRT